MSQYTPEEFDRLVKELRPTAPAKDCGKKKSECTPLQWASKLKANAELKARNRESVNASNRKWYSRNKVYHRKRYAESRDRMNASSTRWRKANPERTIEIQRKHRASNPDYAVKRAASDVQFRIQIGLRNRINQAVRRGYKTGSAVRDLGMTAADFKAHIESRFQLGWSWDNWGSVWELDHIYPLTAADLVGSRPEFLAANNWRNLQPLSVEDNRRKGDKVTPEAQALFDQLVAEFTDQT